MRFPSSPPEKINSKYINKNYKKQKKNFPRYRKNEEILVDKVILIDAENKNHGKVDLFFAINCAIESHLDLVEVSPKTTPPVCKILDLGQFQYDQKKKMRAQQKNIQKVVIKGIKLSQNIGKHDLETKIKQEEKFFSKGNKIKIEMQLKGRERKYVDLGKEVIIKFIEDLKERGNFDILVEDDIKIKNGRINCILALKKK